VLAGDGPLQGRLRQEADTLKIRERVRFLNTRHDIPDILAASDLFVLSSDVEGLPLAVMEAMAAGLPVVATAVGGVPELLTDGREGLIVAPGDADALKAAIARLIDSPDQRKTMGRCAESKALATFDIARTVRSYVGLYKKLVSEV
jgi:glycosyltransferase involved in cell wall biosynthesis